MRVSCEVPRDQCSATLLEDLKQLGIEPIITPSIVRAVYEGTSVQLGEAIVARFKLEHCHGIVSYYDKAEVEAQKRTERKKRRRR